MFDTLSRSWDITKVSWRVLVADKEILLFPALSALFSVLYFAALLVPTIVTDLLNQQGDMSFSLLEYALLFVTYLGLAFIATFFNVCTVYTTKVRFEGGDATFGESVRFALSRIGLIFTWSLVSATVGLVLRLIDHAAARVGGIGEIILGIVRSLLGAAWSVLTLFVVPAMVYREEGPLDAIKTSVSVLKRTWGESLVRHFGLGWAQTLVLLPGIALGVVVSMAVAQSPTLLVIGVSATVLYAVVVVLIFSVLNSVFNTALYVYGDTGAVPGHFEGGLLQDAFESR